MRKLKITTAVLVVLFVCQAVFAGFVPVKEADPELIHRLTALCDTVQRMGYNTDHPAKAFLELASAADEDIRNIGYVFNLTKSYESVTTAEELETLFPFGVEDASVYNLFRRAAVHLAFHAQKNGTLHDTAHVTEAEAFFRLFGYGFAVELENGDTVRFKFIDFMSEEKLNLLANRIGHMVPGVTDFQVPRSGEFVYKTTGFSEFGFAAFVNSIKSIMHDFLIG